jgi:protein involved in polysaccharide export with SLBB domain
MTRRASRRLAIVAAFLAFVFAVPTLLVADQVPTAPSVFIMGPVKTYGFYKLGKGLTVGQLIAMAGGLTPQADASRILIIRRAIYADRLLKLPATMNTPLRAADTVAVAKKPR